jgi:hypothetical protein
LVWVGFWWLVSTIMFAFVNIPLAIANGAYAFWLIWLMVKDDSATNAKRIYKYSVAFPYVVGTVAGFQLVFFMALEIL